MLIIFFVSALFFFNVVKAENIAAQIENDILHDIQTGISGTHAFGSHPTLSNSALIQQKGSVNTSILNQQGQNDLQLYQLGKGNFADLEQDGGFNRLLVVQTNDNNFLELNQEGYNHQAIVTQSGNKSLSITQTGFSSNLVIHQK
ncbi:MAG: hypothetical protein AAGB12_15945 [Pseudomonadota bacterium]